MVRRTVRPTLPVLTIIPDAEDGHDHPVVVPREREVPPVDVSAASHPFRTGTARALDTEGRVEKFRRR